MVDLYNKTNPLKMMLVFFVKLTGYPCFSLLLKFSRRYPIRQQLALLPSGQRWRRASLLPEAAQPSRGRRGTQEGAAGKHHGRAPPSAAPASRGARESPLSVGHGWRCNRYLYDRTRERTSGDLGGSPPWLPWRSGARNAVSPWPCLQGWLPTCPLGASPPFSDKSV